MISNLNSYRLQAFTRHGEVIPTYTARISHSTVRTNLNLKNYPVSNLIFFSATALVSNLTIPNVVNAPEYSLTNIYSNVFFTFQIIVPMLKV